MKSVTAIAIRSVYPLSLRQKLFYRYIARTAALPGTGDSGYPLALANVSLKRLLPTDISHRQLGWMGFYELALSRAILKIARGSGGLLVDVGANIGYFSILWAAADPRNHAVAFEASTRNLGFLKENLEFAGTQERVRVEPFALGREAGVMAFDVGPEAQTGWGGLSLSTTASTVQVEVRRLDGMLDSDERISVLKIDVEGADAWVLEGAEQLLRKRQIKNVFFECNRPRMDKLGIPHSRPLELLRDCGYRVSPLSGPLENCCEFHAVPGA